MKRAVEAPANQVAALLAGTGGGRTINAQVNNLGLIEVRETNLTINGALTTGGTVRVGESRTLAVNSLDITATGLVTADGPGFIHTTSVSGAAQDSGNFLNLAITAPTTVMRRAGDRCCSCLASAAATWTISSKRGIGCCIAAYTRTSLQPSR